MAPLKWSYHLDLCWYPPLGIEPFHFLPKAQFYWLFYEATFDYLTSQLSTVLNSTLRTATLESGSIFTNFTMEGHLSLPRSSFNNTMSLTWKSRFFVFHFCWIRRFWRNSFLQRDQNSPAICWIFVHLRREYKSGLSKLPGGGKITLVFCVSRLLDESGIWPLTSLSVYARSGMLLMIPSVSANSVLKFSSFKLHEWVLRKTSSIVLAVPIWCSQTLPICETAGELFS